MQLDQTRIAVRERSLGDILDLALHVSRRFIVPLMLMFGLGAAPLMLINYALIGWLVDVDERTSFYYLDEGAAIARYVWSLALLTVIEAPLASIFATAYLGQAVFVDRPRLRSIVSDVTKMAGRVLWCQLVIRGVLPALLLVSMVERYSEFSAEIEGFFLPLIALYAVGLRCFRPYINEVVLLERNPLVSRDTRLITIGRRSAQLHNPSASDLLGRGLATSALAVALTLAFFSTMTFVSGVFLDQWAPGPRMFQFGLPLAMWLAAMFLTVARFLSYLDLRIRQEGWEVELRMRAEAQRVIPPSGIWLVLFGLMVASPTIGFAQERLTDEQAVEAARQQLRWLPWYDSDSDSLRRIDAKPPKDLKNRLSRWEAAQPSNRWNRRIPQWVWTALEVLGWCLLIGLLAVAVYFLVRAFMDYEDRTARTSGVLHDFADGEVDRIEALPFQLKNPQTDLLGEARRHYEAGEFDDAMVYLYSYQLVALDRHHVIRLSRGKTNRQYLREVRRSGGPVELMETSVIAFEDVFFGRHSLTRSRFEACWDRLGEFQQSLQWETAIG